MLQSIAERGRALVTRDRRGVAEQRSANLAHLCEDLLSRRGEASGVALAREILSRYAELKTGPRIAFFEALAKDFGPDPSRLGAAATAWMNAPSDATAAKLHRSSEPRRLELFRRLNLAPGGTAALVRMRAQLLEAMDHRDDLAAIDDDFLHLFSSWFNRGFLVLRSIDWSTPANLLEKIIRYEAVHAIRDWNDLRARIDSPDRRCYAFFHPALVDEPLIFVEVALTEEDRALLETLDRPEWWRDEIAAENVREPLLRAAAWYYLRARTARGVPRDSVARFHLGNGARLERLNFAADTSERALRQSHGLMVNYLYDLEHIEQNHEAYAQQHAVVAASAVTRLVKAPARDVVAVEE